MEVIGRDRFGKDPCCDQCAERVAVIIEYDGQYDTCRVCRQCIQAALQLLDDASDPVVP